MKTRRRRDRSGALLAQPIWQGPRRWRLIALVANGILQGVLSVSVARLAADGYMHAMNSRAVSTALLGLLAGAGLLLGYLRYRERYDGEWLGQHYVAELRLRLFEHFVNADLRAASRLSRGGLMLRFVTDLTGIRQWVAVGLPRMLVAVPATLVVLLVLSILTPWLGAAFAALLTGGLWLGSRLSRRLERAVSVVRDRRGDLAATVADRIGAVATLQACGQEWREVRRLRRQGQALNEALLRRARLGGVLRALGESGGVLFTAAALGLGGLLVAWGSLPPRDLLVVMVLAGLFVPILRDIAQASDYRQGWRVSQQRARRVLMLPSKIHRRRRRDSRLPVGAEGRLRLSGLRLDGLAQPFDAVLEKDDRVLLTGPNAGAKSALLQVLVGLWSVEGGEVWLDEFPLHLRGRELAGGEVALVAPELRLLRGSIRRNLLYLNPEAEPDALVAALADAGLESLLQRLPAGLDSRVGEDGSGLSRSERARVALARAVLGQPRVLLLDDMGLATDATWQQALGNTLKHFSGVVLCVGSEPPHDGHRWRSWRMADAGITEMLPGDDPMSP